MKNFLPEKHKQMVVERLCIEITVYYGKLLSQFS